jgi:hypothetical protein
MSLAHPSSVSFGGLSGGLLRFTMGSASAGIQDVTGHGSSVLNGKVIREYVCTSIDSGTASVTMLGSTGFSNSDVGTFGTLSVTTPGGSMSAPAFLRSFTIEAEVGDLVRSTAEFTLVGG